MTTDNLKQKAASGMIWTAVQRYSTMAIAFIADIILARLLMPSDYGYIGMLAIFMGLAENFIDGGFGSALIQKKNPSQTDYSTVFYFNIGMAVVIYLMLYFGAPIIGDFYHMPLLCDILRIQGLIVFVYSFSIIQRNQIRKNLQFKKLSWITIVSCIVSLTVTIIMAYKGYGVWSLVVQNMLMALIPCIFFWITTQWRPILSFSWKSFKELFGFGSYMFFTHIVNTFANKLNGLLIGRWYDSSTMGYFSKAEKTENLASMNIASIMIQTTYPLYSSIQDDKERLINVIKRITSTLSYITTPLLFVLLLTAKPLFVLLYSDKWLPCVPYFQLLCIAGLAACLQGVNIQAIAAVGKSKEMFVWTIVKRAIGIGLNIGGLLLFGMKGLLVGAIMASWFSYLINASLVSKFVGYKLYRQLLDLAPALMVSVIAALVSYFISRVVSTDMYAEGVIRASIFIVVFMGWSLLFKPSAYEYTFSIIKMIINKKKK